MVSVKPAPIGSEVAAKADFSGIRYAQCWEDADILLEGLDIQPGDVCLSIASAGDNSLAMLTREPARVIALDLSPAQLACLELRVAAYRELSHPELLELIGSAPSNRREALYRRCRSQLSAAARDFWDGHATAISEGIGGAGKFEHYFALFRNRVLPLVHSRKRVDRLIQGGTLEQRTEFYNRQWDTWRWRLLFRIFFSRFVMGRMGRDPSFFTYVEGNVAERILMRTRHALTVLDPAANPYLQWIVTDRHVRALPLALRPENFEVIRANLDRVEWHEQSLEDFLASQGRNAIDRFNLSDIFEYMSAENYHTLLEKLVAGGRPGGRLAYWNMLVPRSRPASMAGKLRPLTELAGKLHLEDKAFFYSSFVIEEIL
jgi:S-adenosylmethionine-diacylglycerol 3-amino-3-carboxypropyl transferase